MFFLLLPFDFLSQIYVRTLSVRSERSSSTYTLAADSDDGTTLMRTMCLTEIRPCRRPLGVAFAAGVVRPTSTPPPRSSSPSSRPCGASSHGREKMSPTRLPTTVRVITGDRHRAAVGPSVHRHVHRDRHLVDVHVFPRLVHHETGRVPVGGIDRGVQRR